MQLFRSVEIKMQYLASTYNKLERHLEAFLAFLEAMYNRSSQNLHNDERIQSYANAVMRVGQGSLRPDSLETQHDKCSCEQQRQDLKPNMNAERKPRVTVVEPGHEDGTWDNEEEGDGGENTVSEDERLVASHVAKAIAHT